jgi:3-oxoacyl-[acyl-carrier-protein] synthase-3
MSLGIMAIGHALGDPVTVDALIAAGGVDERKLRGWGYRRLYRAADGVGLTDLAAKAGESALRNAGVAADEVDLIVLAVSDLAEYLYWDAAAAVQGRLGLRNAEAVLISQACGGGVTAFDTVAGRFATHPGYHTALVVAANRVVEQYWDRAATGTALSSDGAVAATVRRGHGSCVWLATETISDGRYADFMRMDIGGATQPFSLAHATNPAIPPLIDRMDTFFDGDGRSALAFATAVNARNKAVLEQACARAGTDTSQIQQVIYLNDNRKAFEDLAATLGIPLGATNVDLAMDYGHFGPADQILCLDRLLRAGQLVSGDVVALLSMGSGVHWTCTLLRV